MGKGVFKIFFLTMAVVIVSWAAGFPGSAGVTADQPAAQAPAPKEPAEKSVMTDIHDIRHPRQVGINPAVYYWAAGLVATLAAGIAAWILIRRRMKRGCKTVSDVTAAIYRDPEEEALENLAALEKDAPESPALYYFRLSAVFRNYLKRRFDIDAPEMTTEELLPRLSSLDFDRDLQPGLREFLKFGDRVKFARFRPDSADMAGHLELTRQVVNRTRAARQAAAGQGGES